MHRTKAYGWERGEPKGFHTRAPPGEATPDGAVQAPEMEAPVVTSLTDAERAELARKAAEANKRSEDNARARGGR